MTDFKEVGKNLGTTKKEADYNLSRAKANLPYSQRSVDDININNTYRKEFNIGEGTSVSLDLDIRERPTPCTVTPPEVSSYHYSRWKGEYINGPCIFVGDKCEKFGWDTMYFWKCIGVEDTTGGYQVINYGELNPYLDGSCIVLPYDGCYLVEAQWGGYGVSYLNSGSWGMDIIKRGSSWDNYFQMIASTGPTGYIQLIGPVLYYAPAPNRLIGIAEAKAGDRIEFWGSGGGFGKCLTWVAGTCLKGAGFPGEATLKITLLGTAEDVTLNRDKNDPENTQLKAINCIRDTIILAELNLLVDFYNRLTAKGELPYSNQYWSAKEHWIHFWEAYWYYVGWYYAGSEYPYVAPIMFENRALDGSLLPWFDHPALLNYQAEWNNNRVSTCAPVEVMDTCARYRKIYEQLLQLYEFYYDTPTLPFYIAINGSTEPTVFEDWATFWAWVWDRGYSLILRIYVMPNVWTIEQNILTEGVTPWPPPTTIEELTNYLGVYQSNIVGCS